MDLWPVSAVTLRGSRLLVLLCSGLLLAACDRNPTTATPAVSAGPPAIAYEAHVAAGGKVPPGGTLSNPHAGDAAVAKAGAQLFATMNCDGCHGSEGAGWVGPSLQDGRWRYGGADGEVFSSIYYGRPHGMPAFGGTLQPDGVWALVTYLKSLPVPEGIATESWEADGK
jgi:cytochrome c oxidase cbb3-type subunit 3